MTQSTFSIRMDEDLKRDFNRFCDNVGMTMSTAFVIFAKTAVRERRFPFEIGERPLRGRRADADDVAARARRAFETLRRQVEESDAKEPTLDEINAIISEVRAERHRREKMLEDARA